MELCTAAARAPEFSWVRRNFFRDRRALNFATRRGSNFFDTFHFKTSFPNLGVWPLHDQTGNANHAGT
jgi:hypothetical protein